MTSLEQEAIHRTWPLDVNINATQISHDTRMPVISHSPIFPGDPKRSVFKQELICIKPIHFLTRKIVSIEILPLSLVLPQAERQFCKRPVSQRCVQEVISIEVIGTPDLDADWLDARGDESLKKGYVEKALSYYRKAQLINPGNPLYGTKVVAILLQKGRSEEFHKACLRLKEERRDIMELTESLSPSEEGESMRIGFSDILSVAMSSASLLRQNKFDEFDDTLGMKLKNKIVTDPVRELR
eukprot:Protomagalhaensia_wolfi_Nauph_80__842@NODE_1488_length_1505_cov_28_158254_g1120_i3_p1_GENE_NODE_1488_length_1505_cov_28_158254_g1120_i3NODE_1488_length_1505_cov_28_158254_g1120_i3_p1_ORF_typecomplete_len241_score40_40TPR_15/PF13429_6/0_00013TPR_8/PF13181_6/0_0087TPR_8/PF13181_6/5_4e03TPR_2/PF07719_17/0_092TPR_19/PF14559_6/0_32TPR_1/PF00515_28/0_54TPR_1/PF00515_28/3_5e03_NODE_1488_length_1505_cov_28_158254_g1120_i3192914